MDLAELVPIWVGAEDGELRLRRAQRHLLALERDARGEDRILELVVPLGELCSDEPAFARLSQPVQPLALSLVGARLFLLQRAELLAAEEIRVARDDRGLLGHFFLAHANSAPLLGALVQVPLDLLLELRRRADYRRRHSKGLYPPPEPSARGEPFTS